jgi:hypothetical protein
MPRKASGNTEAVTIKMPRAWLDDAGQIADRETRASIFGVKTTRTDVLRAALERGLEVIRSPYEKAIGDELRRLVAQMDTGVAMLDIEAIRDAASKARALAVTLTEKEKKS